MLKIVLYFLILEGVEEREAFNMQFSAAAVKIPAAFKVFVAGRSKLPFKWGTNEKRRGRKKFLRIFYEKGPQEKKNENKNCQPRELQT